MRYRVSFLMDEIWERAVETAIDGQTDQSAVRSLTLDGAVKCAQGRLPPPNLLEKFQNLQHLSIANIGVSSLEQFPRLQNLQKLILSDNRIAGGLEFLVEAGLDSLRDLDLSNNRIQFLRDLSPLAQLRLVSLDLYECPVTREKDYRSRVFGLIKSLKYLDKMDAEENERPESDDEDEEEEEEDEEEDPGSGEIDGEELTYRLSNGHSSTNEGAVEVDEDEESDADEEETVTNHQANGFLVAATNGDVDGEEDGEDDEDNDSGEEVDDEEDDDNEDVVEVHEIEDSDDEEDEDDDNEIDEDYDDDNEEEVDNDEGDFAEPESIGRLTSTEGEIDGHEQGEDDVEDDDSGETGEDEEVVEVGVFEEDDDGGEDEEEDFGAGYVVQPVAQPEEDDGEDSDMDPGDDEVEEVEDEDEPQLLPPSTNFKRKRDEDAEDDIDDKDDDDIVDHGKSSKKNQ